MEPTPYQFTFTDAICHKIIALIISELEDDITSEIHGEILEGLLDCYSHGYYVDDVSVYGDIIERFKRYRHEQERERYFDNSGRQE